MSTAGHVGHLTAKQQDALTQLRTMTTELPHQEWLDDPYLLRFLRARAFNVDRTFEMLEDHFHWRKETLFPRRQGPPTSPNLLGAPVLVSQDGEQCASFLFEPRPPAPPTFADLGQTASRRQRGCIMVHFPLGLGGALSVLTIHYPGGLHFHDREGSIVYVDRIGQTDPRGLLRAARKADIVQFRIFNMERTLQVCAEQSAKIGRKVQELTIIMDLTGLNRKHLWGPGLDLFRAVAKIYEANYPEVVKRCFIINAPMIFPVMFNLIKPLLHEATRQKIRVLGSDYVSVLSEYIDPAVLPRFLGGTCTCSGEDEFCKKFIRPGGEVPATFFLDSALSDSAVGESGGESTTVGRAATFDVAVLVRQPGSVLSVEYMTKDFDVKFGIWYFQNDDAVLQNGDYVESSSGKRHPRGIHRQSSVRQQQPAPVLRREAHSVPDIAAHSLQAVATVEAAEDQQPKTMKRGNNSVPDIHAVAAASDDSNVTRRYQLFKGTVPKDLDVITETTQADSHLVMMSEQVVCDEPGVYVLRWDNTYSWTRSKQLRYLIEVTRPEVDD
ncbi:hypothetical protein CAOG_00710 [Capsaspora owczarzaki ATCC 30864]|uniref:CRAL-TRIO domain-containing protein n=1 Tax=Capsaspora owczarzaki (strain ATCC 30864) TaxID=595528 RepID=A0A0D2WHQ9_CAPO3|nr:hypothetical protein CAOG_00710 [Capsaspora owczarzaki ATCC 30864]KJE89190.1 hypothetical protein CAOG_000710 [Capsaspora owczarzaki ATCC 30864]|eukprot:XP_004365581.2 hypothetical protein CAOG_00710 [Capsaspora owczarzaki ATCC 30864]